MNFNISIFFLYGRLYQHYHAKHAKAEDTPSCHQEKVMNLKYYFVSS